MRSLLVAILALASVCVSSISFAQAPDSLSFQGYVTDPGGTPINSPGISMTFKLYEGSSEIWSETQPSVKIVDGVFNVLLGSVVPLDTVRFNRPLLLGIKVAKDPEISPRTPLAAAAYAKALPGLYTFYRDDGNIQSYNVVGGADNNVVGALTAGATIGGGGGVASGSPVPNSAFGDYATVGGGSSNTANGTWATVGGGSKNTASNENATVGGGSSNTASGYYATVGGGTSNTTSDYYATVGGGVGNTASGLGATVSGGVSNTASGLGATVSGGYNTASGLYSTVPGGRNNSATKGYSFAAGRQAKANHSGTFVWADSASLSGIDFPSTGDNQFLIRAAGGVGIGTNTPRAQLHVDAAGTEPIDIMLGGSGPNDNGTISTDSAYSSSDLILKTYDDLAIHLDEDADENGRFLVVNDLNNVVFSVEENGDTEAAGILTKGGGSFKIDHPLDPTNKFLFHSFVESPDMKNIYDGIVVTDGNGEAIVEMPSYFEALNREFRYQLTCIGGFANVYISSEIENNRFGIAGGASGLKVSWMVTGVRKDAFAEENRIQVEVDKEPFERGTYLHPEAFWAGD